MGINLDFTHCLAEAIGATHGLTKDEVSTLVAKFPSYHKAVEERFSSGASAFGDVAKADPAPVLALAKKHKGAWEDVVVFGAGGSVASPRAVVRSLTHRHFNDLPAKARGGAPRMHFLGHADPLAVVQQLDAVDPKKTLFICASRGGASPDTLAELLIVADLLKRKAGKTALANQLIVATDPGANLGAWAKQEGATLLAQPANLAGRFAVVGPASLFTAALAGLSVPELLAGAAEADKRSRTGDATTSPAYMHALLHYLLTRKRRKTIHATWPFAERLGHVAQWYNHVLAVSLGKMNNRQGKAVHVGPSPEMAVGCGDLHGQLQLYAEGPYDKVVTFIAVKDHGGTLGVPAGKLDGAQGVAGADLATLAANALTVAEEMITGSGRPACTLTIDKVDERHVAGLCHTLLLSAVMSAELYGIDAFDQPGVDHARAGCIALLGRAGFEDRAKRLHDLRGKPRKTA